MLRARRNAISREREMIADRIEECENLIKHLRLQDKRAKLKVDTANEDIGAILHLLKSNRIAEQSESESDDGM